ncbi:MAG: TrmB family transcriptional regulator [Candidatus Magasanikbacteria bacterium]|jgi:HTH-type transcriptional regulator, sugar sensing transcriptional regulator|nr:TrmB family transcriptional regulator [Candidatus Magasanikbacteria bacterium]MBT4314586.1 TrmB family transcriptional regulator [Candidatus Magasanikbacteria bacterium]MBT4546781.1 TrmB family transcriptional regulator [Candidatus Magasanikbacteria bacterium]MBT6818790.1 TrmB family transcriptional regulator [Candidatus Magasanikbacteria bacterium]
MDINLLKKLGFSDKEAKIYLGLLRLGPSSVRKLAEISKINRGTAYDILKSLQDKGIVSYYNKATKQQFVAENPEKLHDLVKKQQDELDSVDSKLDKLVPELQALHHKGGDRPVARYYAKDEINKVLEDVLTTCEGSEEKLYRIYSAEGLREYLYENFPTFSDVRIAKGVGVKVIAIGEGGELRGLDERKWLKTEEDTNTYIIIYPGKTAYISLNAKSEPIGVVIENDGVCKTQKLIFDNLWKSLN